jgi:Arc/MetJ family transcription regulator
MTTTTVPDVDAELLAAARAELGTATEKDTVNAALRTIANRRPGAQGRLSDEALLALGVGPDIDNPEIMTRARR